MRFFITICTVILFAGSAWLGCGPTTPEQEKTSTESSLPDASTQENTPDTTQPPTERTQPPTERTQPPQELDVTPEKTPPTERTEPPKDAPPSRVRVDLTPLGSRVAEYFKDDKYKSLLIEVDYMKGMKPSQKALDAFKAKIEELRTKSLLKKPGGIQIKLDQEITETAPAEGWKIPLLQQLEFKYRQNMPSGTQAVAYFLYVDGNWHQDSSSGKVLGIAYSGSTMTVFKKTVDRVCQSASVLPGTTEKLCSVVEASIVLHEFAHIMGMTNIGLKMATDHEDKDHKGHCNNKDCVNYWSNNQSSMANSLGSAIGSAPSVLPFGQECLNDMAAVHKQ